MTEVVTREGSQAVGGRPRPSPKPRPRRRRPGFSVVAVLPFALVLAVFAVYPLVELVRMAVSETRLTGAAFSRTFIGFENFVGVFDSPVAWDSVVNTVVFVAATVPLTLVLGLGVAILVDRATITRKLGQVAMLWPAVIAPVVVSVIWLLILSPSIGVLNDILETAGLPAQGWLGSGAGAMAVIIAVDVWHWTPLVFLLVYTSLQNMDTEVIEAARVDGADERRLLWHVVLPLLKPTLIAAGLIRLVMGVKAFDEMYLLTHGGPGTATTLVSHYIRNVFFDQLQFGRGAAFSVVIVFAIGLGILVVASLRTRRSEPA